MLFSKLAIISSNVLDISVSKLANIKAPMYVLDISVSKLAIICSNVLDISVI